MGMFTKKSEIIRN